MKKGFTLIELAIVLVVVSILVSVTVGAQSIIKSAKIRNTIQLVEDTKHAVRTFQLAYDSLPGDFDEAESYWPGQTTNGNGDRGINGLRYATKTYYGRKDGQCFNRHYRKIDTHPNGVRGWIPSGACDNYGVYAEEWIGAFDHLALAEIAVGGIDDFDETSSDVIAGVSFPKLNLPVSDTGLIGGLAFGYVPTSKEYTPYMRAGHKITLGLCGSEYMLYNNWAPTPYTNLCGLNPWDTEIIDKKIDDGKPYTGEMVTIGSYYPYRTDYVWGIGHNGNQLKGCTTGPTDLGGTNQYRSKSDMSGICAPYIDMGL